MELGCVPRRALGATVLDKDIILIAKLVSLVKCREESELDDGQD